MKPIDPPNSKPLPDGWTPTVKASEVRRWDPSRGISPFPDSDATETIADRLAVKFAARIRMTRRNCHKHGFMFNGPLHSWVSELERRLDLPVSRQSITVETGSGAVTVSEYWFDEKTIEGLTNPATRAQFARQIRRKRETRFISKNLGCFTRLLVVLKTYRAEFETFHPNLICELKAIRQRIDEIIKG